MKVDIKRSKGAMTVRFTAENSDEGIALKDAVLTAGKDGFTPARVIEELGKSGYEAVSAKRLKLAKRSGAAPYAVDGPKTAEPDKD